MIDVTEYEKRLQREQVLLAPFRDPTDTQPFTVLKDLITPEERDQIRKFFHEKKATSMATHIVGQSDYDVAVISERIFLPRVEAMLKKMFPTMMVYRTVYLAGRTPKGHYSGWHCDYNGTKTFKGRPIAWNLWIPLQSLNEETGGRLWFYNGNHMSTIENILRLVDKKSMLFMYILMDLVSKELDANKTTKNANFGEGFLFSEMLPHMVDDQFQPSGETESREVLTLWLIEEDAVLDKEFVQEVVDFPVDGVINQIETKVHIQALERFVTQSKALFEISQDHLTKEKQQTKDSSSQ